MKEVDATEVEKGVSISWIPVRVCIPQGSPIVFMYSEENNEFSVGHFKLERGGVRTTHWHPLTKPDIYAEELVWPKK